MDLTTAKYNRTRNLISIHGKEYTVKQQRGRYYIHAENKQITVTDIVNRKEQTWDLFQWYVLDGLFENFPCVVMDWWMKMRIKNSYIRLNEYSL